MDATLINDGLSGESGDGDPAVVRTPSEPWVSQSFNALVSLLCLANPYYWIRTLVFWLFGSDSAPEYLTDFLPLSIFYDKSEGPSGFIFMGGILLCLIICGTFEIYKSPLRLHLQRHTGHVVLCKITPREVQADEVNARIEEAFSVPRLMAVCFVFDVVHEITPVEAFLLIDYIKNLAAMRKVEVFSFVENSALSVGYLLCLVGDQIFATKASVVGNLKFCKSGRALSMSSKGHNYYEDINLDDGRISAVADDLFMEKIREHRGEQAVPDGEEANGIWIGDEAREKHLVDGICNIHKFLRSKFPRAKLRMVGNSGRSKIKF